MKRKLREVMDLLDYNELMNMKNDLKKGGDGIRILIENRIKQELKKHEQYCTICANKLGLDSATTFTLMFGPEEFKKKATFCAMDCLEYFLLGLKKVLSKKEI